LIDFDFYKYASPDGLSKNLASLRVLGVYPNFSFTRRRKLSVRLTARLISFSAIGAGKAM